MATRGSTTQSAKGILDPSSKMMLDYSKAQTFDWQKAEEEGEAEAYTPAAQEMIQRLYERRKMRRKG